MTRAVLATLLLRSLGQDFQMGQLMRFAVEHDLDTVAITRCDPAGAVAAVRAGSADVVLAVKPDTGRLLELGGVPVTYLRPPRPPKPDARPLHQRAICGVPGRFLLGALERTAGDTVLVATVFGLPLEVVVEFDAERRQRTGLAA